MVMVTVNFGGLQLSNTTYKEDGEGIGRSWEMRFYN